MRLSYLKPNVILEPLVDQWYAWAHLISPATAARNVTERHLRILDSFLSAPHVHMAAVRDPRLLGGPFIDHPEERTAELRSLRDRTVADSEEMITLSQGLAALDHLLQTKADGHSLEQLYREIPPVLEGFVELVYDLQGHASFRLLEPLLYRSRFYKDSRQNLLLSPILQDDRPFVLSTPRLTDEGALNLRLPFRHPGIDALARMALEPAPVEQVAEQLELGGADRKLLTTLVHEEAAPPYRAYDGPGVRWRYFGHACILLEARGISMLFDPVLSYTYETSLSRYTYQDLPEKIDYVFITHNHQDHLLFETLLRIRPRIGTVVVPRSGGGALQDPSLKLALEHCGFSRVVELSEMQSLEWDGGFAMGLPFFGEHGDLNIQSKLAYYVRIAGRSLMIAADSNNISPQTYRLIREWTGPVDVLFLGMECDGAPVSWIYGPLFSSRLERKKDQSRRLSGSDCARGVAMIDALGCSEVYVYAMGQEPWLNHVMSVNYTPESNPIIQSDLLIRLCQERNIVAERLFGEKELVWTPKMGFTRELTSVIV